MECRTGVLSEAKCVGEVEVSIGSGRVPVQGS